MTVAVTLAARGGRHHSLLPLLGFLELEDGDRDASRRAWVGWIAPSIRLEAFPDRCRRPLTVGQPFSGRLAVPCSISDCGKDGFGSRYKHTSGRTHEPLRSTSAILGNMRICLRSLWRL